ncbi:MAG: hypothetical protein ACI91F_002477, partial [Candidatus Binatia bacterium]
ANQGGWLMQYRFSLTLAATGVGLVTAAWTLEHTTAASMMVF